MQAGAVESLVRAKRGTMRGTVRIGCMRDVRCVNAKFQIIAARGAATAQQRAVQIEHHWRGQAAAAPFEDAYRRVAILTAHVQTQRRCYFVAGSFPAK